MKQKFGPVFKGDEDVDDWIADFELFMMPVLHWPGDEAKLQTLPLVLRGKAKVWFDVLEDVHKQNWIGFREHFLQRYRKVVSTLEADAKLKGLQQKVRANFDAFVDKLKLIGGILRLLPKQPMRDILSLKGFYPACIPMFMREWIMKIQVPLMKLSDLLEQRVER
ncbi:hypothetical protein GOP47_0006659 [Adiantum capillus-veneris]|uniref:Retrotransposon gag domain-containing protein n=1 Tax=Adiantum capillus-veneris TaxID=13818 RepID=A0A9D4V3H9_ADICA|nr:hypothetical protein GOP47_0006659 [Adiantum capillus-veneris]